jgi:hypothetical protein
MSYQGLNPLTATNDELDGAADDITRAWDDVVDEANDWANADDNALTNAYDDLYYAIQDLPGDNTAADNLRDLQPELDAFPAELVQVAVAARVGLHLVPELPFVRESQKEELICPQPKSRSASSSTSSRSFGSGTVSR